MSRIVGIDVSEWNEKLDWKKIKAPGIKFAIIRTGYGAGNVDKCWEHNIEGAISVGIPIGIYHFSYALNVEEVKKEAAFCLSLIKPYKDYITLPVYYDFEYDTVEKAKKKGVTLGKNEFNKHTVAFCEAIKAGGFTPGVYYNLDYYNNYCDMSKVGGYSQWYAQYSSTPSSKVSGYDMWQYGSSGAIAGINCRFDMNYADESFLTKYTNQYEEGWVLDDVGWWYRYADGSWPAGRWFYVDTWYYAGDNGYIYQDKFVKHTDGYWYYLGSDGRMAANKSITIDDGGKIKGL